MSLLALFGVMALFTAGSATAQPLTLYARMTGAQEIPPRTTNGAGTAVVYVDTSALTVCVSYNFGHLTAPAVAGHIHEAPVTANGPIVVPFPGVPAGGGGSSFCADTDAEFVPPADRAGIVARMAMNPQSFYVNIHSTTFPGGEIRGQLKAAVTTSTIP